MKVAYYIKKTSLKSDGRVAKLLEGLEKGGCELFDIDNCGDDVSGMDVMLSIGGDGTFLTAARAALAHGIPLLGVNFGRLGFLSDSSPEEVVGKLPSGDWSVEERTMLMLGDADGWKVPDGLALNEISVSRYGAGMLGIDVSVDGDLLPTYWADGLLVSTSSGSTAYNLSVGGPICTPDSRVLIIAPVSPHNLNVRPLVVPETAEVGISLRSRSLKAVLGTDNRSTVIPSDSVIRISAAPSRLKTIRLGESNFINALRARLLWGEDVRNNI